MGNNSGRSIAEELDDRFTIVRRLSEPEITLREDKKDKGQYLVRKLVLLKQSEYQREVDRLKLKQQIVNPHVARLVNYHTNVEDMICSRHHTIYAIYEYPHRNLDQQISERFIQKRKFEEKELWSILASCILGLSTLQKSSIPHESLRSEEILLSSTGTIQIADPYCTDATTNYRKLLDNRSSRNIYLAPELCELLAREEILIPETVNPYKADVFTMGMIVLEMGLLEYQYECYRDDFTKINQSKLAERIEELGNQYSQELKIMVELMLQIHPQDRQLWSEMQLFVRKNEPAFVESHLIQDQTDRNGQAASQNTIVQRPNDTKYQKDAFSNGVEDNSLDSLVPVQLSKPIKPRLTAGPTDSYVTRVEPDENLIEISEEETNSEGDGTSLAIAPMKSYDETIQPGYHSKQLKTNPSSKDVDNKPNSMIRQLKPDQNRVADVPAEPISHLQQGAKEEKVGESARGPVHLQPRTLKGVPSSTTSPSLGSGQFQFKPNVNGPIAAPLPKVNYNPSFPEPYRPIVQSSYMPTTSYNYQPVAPSTYLSSYSPAPPYLPPTSYTSALSWKPNPIPNLSSLPGLQSRSAFPTYSVADNRDLFTDYAKLGIPRTYIPNIPNTTYQSKYAYETVNLSSVPTKPAWESTSNFNYRDITESKLAPSPIQAMRDREKDNMSSSPLVGENDAGEVSEQISVRHHQQSLPRSLAAVAAAAPVLQQQPSFPLRKISTQSKANLLADADDTTRNSNPIFVIEHYKQGSRYQGQKVDNLKQGRGKFFYQDGGLYDGQWIKNRMQGKGKLYYQSGKIAYDGQWDNDMFYGDGMLYNQYPKTLTTPFNYRNFDLLDDYWTKVKGHFKEDCKQGKCVLFLQNGESFEGNFETDSVTGPGIFHTLDGRHIKGIWSNNRLISQDQ